MLRDQLIDKINQLKERLGIIYQVMLDDACRPSRYLADYQELRLQYQEIIFRLEEIDPDYVSAFRKSVQARVKGLEAGLDTADNFEEFEELLVTYERNYDLLKALEK